MERFEKNIESQNSDLDKNRFDPDNRLDKSDKKVQELSGKQYDADDKLGERELRDDNGNVYCTGYDLKKNNTWEVNGYEFRSDDKGRLKSAEGKLYLRNEPSKTRIPNGTTIEKIAKGDQKKDDDRGHLLGDQFNGPGDIGNLIAQNQELNRGQYAQFENSLAKEIRNGKDVYVKIDLKYKGNSNRPDKIVVNYSINGEKAARVFNNKAGG